MTTARRLTAGIAAAAALTGAAVATAPAASAETRYSVCAESLYVREAPGGRADGTLYYGQTFDYDHSTSDGFWAYGMAYGNVNKHGWVESRYLC
jgi:hypothetical protein